MNTIRLLLDNKDNSALLNDMLAGEYTVIYSPTSPTESPFDLCIIDGINLDRLADHFYTYKKREFPLFLPLLLVTSRSEPDLFSRGWWELIDETFQLPARTSILKKRIEILLRTRNQSLVLHHEKETLKDAYARLALGMKAGKISYWGINLDTRTITLSREWKEQLGCRDHYDNAWDELFAYIHPDDRHSFSNDLQQLIIKRDSTLSSVYRMHCRDREDYSWFMFRSSFIDNAEEVHVKALILQIDITDQRRLELECLEREERLKHTEVALTESVGRFQTLADNIAQLVWMANPDGEIFWYNKRWYEVTGTTAQEMEKHGVKLIVHTDYFDNVMTTYANAIKSGTPWEHTFPMRDRNGKYRWFLSRAMPIRDENGTIVRWFGTNTDISEITKTQESLQIRTEELVTANKYLESFSYSVSHDLRNPLTIINNFSQILLEDYTGQLDHEGCDLLQRINTSSGKALQLITDMLTLSRIDRQEIKRENVNICAMVREYVQELKRSDPSRKTEIDIHESITAFADPHLVHLALENLLRNTWKFTSKRDLTHIKFGTVVLSGKTVYYIQDNGVGFDKQFAETIFEPFKRGHAQKDFGGTGVGLSIVKRVIERHGGRVWAEGSVDKGATFYFTLG